MQPEGGTIAAAVDVVALSGVLPDEVHALLADVDFNAPSSQVDAHVWEQVFALLTPEQLDVLEAYASNADPDLHPLVVGFRQAARDRHNAEVRAAAARTESVAAVHALLAALDDYRVAVAAERHASYVDTSIGIELYRNYGRRDDLVAAYIEAVATTLALAEAAQELGAISRQGIPTMTLDGMREAAAQARARLTGYIGDLIIAAADTEAIRRSRRDAFVAFEADWEQREAALSAFKYVYGTMATALSDPDDLQTLSRFWEAYLDEVELASGPFRQAVDTRDRSFDDLVERGLTILVGTEVIEHLTMLARETIGPATEDGEYPELLDEPDPTAAANAVDMVLVEAQLAEAMLNEANRDSLHAALAQHADLAAEYVASLEASAVAERTYYSALLAAIDTFRAGLESLAELKSLAEQESFAEQGTKRPATSDPDDQPDPKRKRR